MDGPNFVLFVMDQWRANAAGYWGNEVIKTPNTDLIASEGAGFKWCFIQNPVSTPSRVVMATGWYPHVCGHRTMHHMLRLHEPNLLRYFKDAGYHVWWGGKNDMLAEEVWNVSCDTRMHGRARTFFPDKMKLGDRLYHSFLRGEIPAGAGASGSDDDVAEKAAEFIRSPKAEPFFMFVNQTYPHPPYAVEEPYYSMYDRSSVPDPIRQEVPFHKKPMILKKTYERMGMEKLTEDDFKEMVAVFYGMITKTDRNLGWIIEALKDSGRWDDTVVIVTSDHGDFAGDYLLAEKMQNTFEDVLTNVPFAMRVPGVRPLSAPSEALIEVVDLLPTCLDLAGIELRHTQFGRSLMPVVRGEAEEHRNYVFCEGGALRTEVHTHETDRPRDNPYWPRVALQINEPEVHGKAVMIRSKKWKYVRRLYDIDEIYDLENDPGETCNLIDDESASEIKKKLAAEMATWFIETGDRVPLRWDLRSPKEDHPPWSKDAPDY